jgi:hypothetical protein
MQTEEKNISLNDNLWSLEDLQEKVQTKLANIFSFYNEQEFLDEIHGIEPALDVIEVEETLEDKIDDEM